MASQFSNNLKDETSPYLLQHADNPVDRYAWCEEALECYFPRSYPDMQKDKGELYWIFRP